MAPKKKTTKKAAPRPLVSYSTGRLPLDAASDKVYELGFKVDF
jgi:hypothetical protein